MTSDQDRETVGSVRRARARLARIAGRALLWQRGWWVLGAGAAMAIARPLVLRIADDAPRWTALGRSLGLFVAGSALGVSALVALGRRRRPSELGAARALDAALGLPEVVASGFAFARDHRDEPLATLARRRALQATAALRIDAIFPLPSLRPRLRSAVRFALCAALAVGAGAYDKGLVQALVSPPTTGEQIAAAELDAAARDLGSVAETSEPEKPRDPHSPGRGGGDDRGGERGPSLGDVAREAAQAARRGDRRGALEKLEGLRSAGVRQASRADGLGAALRKMAEALDPASGQRGTAGASRQAATAAGAEESMRLLAQKVRGGDGNGSSGETSNERLLERLDRAGEEARRAALGGKSPGAGDAARALSRAAEALRRGDRKAAAEALEQAASRAAAMEQRRAVAAAEAMAMAEMLDRSGALERAIQMALLGREASGEKGDQGLAMGEGKGDGDGKGEKGSGRRGGAGALRAAIMARLAAMGAADVDGDPGTGAGPHVPDRHRARRDPLEASGSVRAPSQVGDGARAIQAIHGLGRGTEPPASYREVFPSYDAAAEEGLADERIPASRRTAVRRYFQSIRPDQAPREP